MTNSKNMHQTKRHRVLVAYGGFRGSVGMGILQGFPQVFLWIWDGYGDWNSVPRQPCWWVVGVKLSKENIVDMECLMVVAMATNFGTKIAITGFVRTNMSYWRGMVMEGVWVLSRQNADIADTLNIRERCHGNHFLAFCIWGANWCHLANLTEPSVCGAAMRFYVKLLWPLVNVVIIYHNEQNW